MATMDTYEGPGTVLVNNSLLMEAQQVRVSVQSNNREVMTMRKGLAGRSKGPRRSEISIECAVPRDGLEQDFDQSLLDDANVVVVVVMAGTRYQFEGWIDSYEHSQSQDGPAGFNFSIVAGPPSTT